MAYVTQAQLETRMYAVSLAACCDDTTPGTADAAVVTTILDDASGIMDGFLQTAGYPVPVAGAMITAALKHHTSWIGAHFAASRRPEFRDKQGVAPYRAEYLDAMAWGKEVAERRIRLEAAEPTGGAGAAEADTPGGMVAHAYRGQRPAPAPPRRMRGW